MIDSISSIIRNISGGSSSAHAYLIEGKDAGGREAFIQRLSMGLECLETDADARPCGRCAACRQVAAGSSLDVVRMQMSGKTGYKTDDVNAFCERLGMGAYGRHLIGIIEDADCLTEAGQNKLLKTLEEPGDDVIILIGTVNPDHLLSTVRSRCSSIRLHEDDSSDPERSENLRALSEMMLSGSEFHSVRESIEKYVKSPDDARGLIEITEETLRDRMMNGDEPLACAGMIEKCEIAAADIGMGMDRARALKRLSLELKRKK